ncbi:MAG: LCP family protein [Geodermatophilaceae bacterium]|nr:LCP family protein [Geodermatophilaceae bacterium]MDQ3456843.1 LCP family protein [Actinomycetota bacterium]
MAAETPSSGDLTAEQRAGGTAGAGDDDGDGRTGRSRRQRRHRALSAIGALLLVLVLLTAGLAWYATARYAGNITRIPGVFAGLDESTRPAPPSPAPGSGDVTLTFLLVGVDSEDRGNGSDALADTDQQSADVLMLVQIAASRDSAVAVSLPRTSTVPVPGYGSQPIGSAFIEGGPSLLVQTVEALTQVRIDHYVSVDFAGFAEITDAFGGVDVRVAAQSSARGLSLTQGVNHLNGEQALAYVRQRSGLPGGELDRVQRHQNYLRAMMTTISRENLLTDPGRLDDFLLALTDALSVDDTLSDFDVVSLMLSLRELTPADLTFLTVPVNRTEPAPPRPPQSLSLDAARAAQMWSYLREGSLQSHAGEFDQLARAPR